MTDFKQKFTVIQGDVSTRRRLPRLGKIRLGIKKVNAQGKEYPSETSWFVVTDEVAAVYGPEPTELDILLPSDDPAVIFPQSLRLYGSGSGLKCIGDGKSAERYDEQAGEFRPYEPGCPCEHLKSDDNPKGGCTVHASLMVLLPRVSLGGVYEIRTSSFNSIVDVNSGLDMVRGMAGRIAMVPIKLRRVARQTQHDGKKKTHYTLFVGLDANITDLNKLREDTRRVLEVKYQIEGPSTQGPAADPVDEVDGSDEPEDVTPVVTPAPVTPLPPPPKLVVTMNPDGEEREAQAKLSEPVPPADLYERPETRAAATANRPAMTDAQFEAWNKIAVQHPSVYVAVKDKLSIPHDHRPINRSIRERFRNTFEEIAKEQKVKL